eukprot:TRINITY_DN56357_c0_g1_i1.p1 TRINITY_DN56357_c0_g1~~TRINITY_DN56357_c0_g1_i1.p1  ORF type:complete len:209 (-),score=21.33 TRINITY_DN56357_c0_g1_i1:80-706(-)
MAFRSAMSRLVERAFVLSSKRPLVVNSVLGGVLMGAGDGGAQCIEARHVCRLDIKQPEPTVSPLSQVDGMKRSVSMFFLGVVMSSVVCKWYACLDAWFLNKALKVLFHQSVWSPTYNFVFLCYVEVVQSPVGCLDRMCRRLEADWFRLTSRSFSFWLCVNSALFTVVPTVFRPATMNVLNCGWVMYISWVGHRNLSEERHSCQPLAAS